MRAQVMSTAASSVDFAACEYAIVAGIQARARARGGTSRATMWVVSYRTGVGPAARGHAVAAGLPERARALARS